MFFRDKTVYLVPVVPIKKYPYWLIFKILTAAIFVLLLLIFAYHEICSRVLIFINLFETSSIIVCLYIVR